MFIWHMNTNVNDDKNCINEKTIYEVKKCVKKVGDIANFTIMKIGSSKNIKRVEELSIYQFKRGLDDSAFGKRYTQLQNIETLPITWFELQASSCVLIDNEVNGLVLVHKQSEEELEIVLIYSSAEIDKLDTIRMIKMSLESIYNNYKPETELVIRYSSLEEEQLINKMFQQK